MSAGVSNQGARGRRFGVGDAPAAYLLGAGVVAAAILGLVIGAADVTLGQIAAVIGAKLGVTASPGAQVEVIVWSIRLPRVLMGVCVGAGLALCGAALQGMFRNPLADPGLIGVSSGAAAGAATAVVAGWALESLFGWMQLGWIPQSLLLPAAAFVGGLAATLVVYRIATNNGRTSVATMLLAGIAVNAAAGSIIGLLTYAADEAELRSLTLWTLGSLGSADWAQLAVCASCLGVAGWMLVRRADEFDALLLGEHEARDLGVDVAELERRIVVISAVVVGASVAFTGLIGFVGLVAPHIVRLWRGPSHRHVLGLSMLLGALLLVCADTVSRTVVAPAELPIGIVTSLVGAPFFLYLLVRRRSEYYL
ncbi:iron ABC transporter permease [Persicimonas caeni]|uniref:Iron ABC transporter permease n=1 Tax=Persicimonas caeni TaxID=2292766 RepID=A0A4Y6PS47_PERCE|nr:iron ABC transporter permease [Persicimonas caeni]QDG50837.1 iron ABC transporter permease [Persicimonas caeni]QED32058.1 iron ABC transporter permease [Persicimonas caeni]